MTLNQLISLFKSIGDAHYFIKQTEYGDVPMKVDANTEATNYPAFYQVATDTVTREQTVERTFTLVVCDLVYPGKENLNDVLSDTEQTLNDIVKILRQESDYYTLLGDPQLLDFKDRYGDAVAGWQCDVVIETQNSTGYCDIPAGEFGFPGEGGTTGGPTSEGLACSDLVDCPVIQDIQEDITALQSISTGFGAYTEDFFVADWQTNGASPWYWISFVHNLDSSYFVTEIWDNTSGMLEQTIVEKVVQDNSNTITIFVPKTPDNRFEGRIVLNGKGATGTSGYSGYSGFSGTSGFSGVSGYSGINGVSISGFSGYSGISGSTGSSGYSGYSGISGHSGYSGSSGYSGASGVSGYSGMSGYSGSSGFSGSAPTLNSTYVGFGNLSNVITGSSNFVFNDASKLLTLKGNIRLDTNPTLSTDGNLLYMGSDTQTGGYLFSAGTVASSTYGPYFLARGNNYTTYGGQRGLIVVAGGNVSGASGIEGGILFANGADQARMLINSAGRVLIGTTTDPTYYKLYVKDSASTGAIFGVENFHGGFGFGFNSLGGYAQPMTSGKGMYFYNAAGTSYMGVKGGGGFELIGTANTKISNPGVCLYLDSTNGNSAKIALQDNGTTRGYFGADSANSFTMLDTLGYIKLGVSSAGNVYTSQKHLFGGDGVATTPTAFIHVKANSTSNAQIRLEAGTAPTSPNNGDIWFDGTNICVQVGGVTKTIQLI